MCFINLLFYSKFFNSSFFCHFHAGIHILSCTSSSLLLFIYSSFPSLLIETVKIYSSPIIVIPSFPYLITIMPSMSVSDSCHHKLQKLSKMQVASSSQLKKPGEKNPEKYNKISEMSRIKKTDLNRGRMENDGWAIKCALEFIFI